MDTVYSHGRVQAQHLCRQCKCMLTYEPNVTALTINKRAQVLHLLDVIVRRSSGTHVFLDLLAKSAKNVRVLGEIVDGHRQCDGSLDMRYQIGQREDIDGISV